MMWLIGLIVIIAAIYIFAAINMRIAARNLVG